MMKALKATAFAGFAVLLMLSMRDCATSRERSVANPDVGVVRSPTGIPPTPTAAHCGNEAYLEVFEVVWSTVDETYFDPQFGGLDWDGIHDRYAPLAAAEDDEALYGVLNRMLWQLDVSHTGVGPADMWTSVEPAIASPGKIGLDVRLLDEQAVVTRVEAASPAAQAGFRPGFVIQAIDGVPVAQILLDARDHLTPPYNEAGRVDGLTRRLLSMIYGEPDTRVTLAYLDEDDVLHERSIKRIARQRGASMPGIPLPPSYLEFEAGVLEAGIGYIRFNTFHPDLIPDMVEAVAALSNAPGIIIDLRGNPGGDGRAGEALAGQFLKERTLFGSLGTRAGVSEWVVDPKGLTPVRFWSSSTR
jgi:carboxyl-terminal processing protease